MLIQLFYFICFNYNIIKASMNSLIFWLINIFYTLFLLFVTLSYMK